MKRFSIVFLSVLFLFQLSVFVYATPSEWAEESLARANFAGIIPESILGKDVKSGITREEFCELCLKLYIGLTKNEMEYSPISVFSDATNPKLTAAFGLKIASGNGEGNFEPQRRITRQEMSKMILNTLEAAGVSFHHEEEEYLAFLKQYKDGEQISDWAKISMGILTKEGVLKGSGDFAIKPLDSATKEQAIVTVQRVFSLLAGESDTSLKTGLAILTPSDYSILPQEDLLISWQNFLPADKYVVYVIDKDEKTVVFRQAVKEKKLIVPKEFLAYGGGYEIVVASSKLHGELLSYSRLVNINIGENFHPSVNNKRELEGFSEKSSVTLMWDEIKDIHKYKIELYNKGKKISEKTTAQNEYTLTGLSAQESYEIRLFSMLDEQTKTIGFDRILLLVEGVDKYPLSKTQKYEKVFPDGEFSTKEEAEPNMETIKIPVWRLNSRGEKYAASTFVTVNRAITKEVAMIFEEIYNGEERFPIKDVGCYNWREPMRSGRLSHHNYGTAIDINANENYCIYKDGTTIGSHWKPGEDPYSIKEDGEVVKIFAKYGFVWGGNAWSDPKDYMHFSYLGL